MSMVDCGSFCWMGNLTSNALRRAVFTPILARLGRVSQLLMTIRHHWEVLKSRIGKVGNIGLAAGEQDQRRDNVQPGCGRESNRRLFH